MKRKRVKIWSLKRLVTNTIERQKRKLDLNIAVSGATGVGKSTFVAKFLFLFPNFNPRIHQVYNRTDVIKLLTTQQFGICWDDEAINSSYKRDFQNSEQRDLIRSVAMFRNKGNIYISVLPEFFSLDKDLRDYYAFHIFIIRRGLACMLKRDTKSIYLQDRWHKDYNEKLEKSWQFKKAKNSKFKPPYHKLKGFVCYIKYNDITEKQRKLIEEIKEQKRSESFQKDNVTEKTFIDKVFEQVIQSNLTKEGFEQLCLTEGYDTKKTRSFKVRINMMLKDNGYKTLTHYLKDGKKKSNVEEEEGEHSGSSLVIKV